MKKNQKGKDSFRKEKPKSKEKKQKEQKEKNKIWKEQKSQNKVILTKILLRIKINSYRVMKNNFKKKKYSKSNRFQRKT